MDQRRRGDEPRAAARARTPDRGGRRRRRSSRRRRPGVRQAAAASSTFNSPSTRPELVDDPAGADRRRGEVDDRPDRVALTDRQQSGGGRDMAAGDARIVDQHVEAAALRGDLRRGSRDAVLVGDVELDESRAQLLRDQAAAGLVARGQPHVVAVGQQPPRGLAPEALVCSGDECRGHVAILGRDPRRHKGTGVPRTRRATLAPRACAIIRGMTVAQEELAGCIRSWRERLSPAEAGLPAGSQRRVSGLRREEVAQLAGVSVDYLARLEQGPRAAPLAVGARSARPRATPV